ncbi:hypothetical protein L1987_83503 [Smallanthus sonchifolius]|uniref:Uncharacterized protein n=1 Tax=Smallanthus sonchifolius TaxID=185202 RepID=A0ACB8YCT2_9ASTR|nr:hypothetical protein L1987_83503 [Smallanthus sonchifolius]
MQYQHSKTSLWDDLESFRIPLTEINLATGHFSPKTRLVDDEYCNVYKGKLCDRVAAIKCQNWRGSEGMEFLLLSKCSHEHIIPFIESMVYSFGVVLFELISGMLTNGERSFGDVKPQGLIKLVRRDYDAGLDKPYKLVDPTIKDQVDIQSFLAYIEVASKCISFNLKDRHSMNRIVKTIEKLLNFQNNGSASTTNIRSPESEKIEDFKIPLEVMKMVTKDFSTKAQIGDGRFGIVYKGKLPER